MLFYDSMRVRDDLREFGENCFWVKESDYNEILHKLESAKVERDNAAQIATEADALMAEMAEALDYLKSRHVVEADVEYGAACKIAQTALKHYQEYVK